MTEQRWAARPRLADLVRVAVLVVPLTGAVGAGALCAWLLPAWPYVARLVCVIAVSALSLLLLDRAARRLLPLESLLRLALLFPGRAPRRFRLALRAGSTRKLRQQGDADSDAIAALLVRLARHDRGTRRHSERVGAYVELLGEQLRLSTPDRDRLRWAALLHDLGKLEVEPAVLNKAAALDDSEWQRIRRHPAVGADLAEPLRGFLGPWFGAIAEHHERWDGSGYPAGMREKQISLAGRIVAVADSFEVMTADRPYRSAMDPAAARVELVRCGGSQFDPSVVRALLDISVSDLRRVLGPLAVLASAPLVGLHPGAGLHPLASAHPAVVPSGHDAAGHPAYTGHSHAGDGGGTAAGMDDR